MFHLVVEGKLSVFVQMDEATTSEWQSDFLGRSATDLHNCLKQVGEDAAHLFFANIGDDWDWSKVDSSQLMLVDVLLYC